MRFISKFTIKPNDIPKYTDFNNEFVIKLDKQLCKLILDNGDERLTPEMKSYFQSVYDKISSKTDTLKVKYFRKNGVGRFYSDGILVHSKYIKNTIFTYLGWKDYDQKKGHPTILLELGLRNNLSMKAYEKYIEKFDDICDELISYYSVEGETPIGKGDVKELFNLTIYGGGHSKWAKIITQEGLDENELLKLRRRGKKPIMMKNVKKPHEFYTEFLNETKNISDKICSNNDALKAIVCVNQDGSPMIDDSMKPFSKIRNKLMSQFCGIIENEITYRAYKYVCNNHKEIKKNVDWGYDGFTIPQTKERVDIDALNQYVRGTTKFNRVCIIEKAFDPKYVLTEIINQRRNDGVKEDEDEDCYYSNIDTMKLIGDYSEYGIMNVLIPVLTGMVVYCNEVWWGYNPKTGLWINKFIPINLIMNILTRDITSLKRVCENNPTAENNEMLLAIGLCMGNVSGYKTGSNVVKLLCSPLRDDDFEGRLNNSLYKMVFKNGIWDLKTLEFREGFDCDDYITETIPHNFNKPTKEEEEEFMKEMKKICNWNDSHLDYFMSHLGYAMTSDSSREQKFLYTKGVKASNGKSLPYEALTEIMPNYVKKASGDILDKGSNLNKDIHACRGLKILWLNEMSVKPKDEDVVKAFADGTTYTYKPLYSTSVVEMPITFKLHTVSNNTIVIKADGGVTRRMDYMNANSHFSSDYTTDNFETCQFIMNKDMRKTFIGRLRNAMIWCIGKYSQMYWIDKCLKPYPEDWREEKDEILSENNKFQTWFFENYEEDVNGVTYRTEIQNALKMSGSGLVGVNVRDEISRLTIKCVYDYKSMKQIGGVRHKGSYTGFKEIEL